LLNRRALDETLPKVVQQSQKSDVPSAVMMIDVDNFKPLNDTLGHAAGDDLLRSLGQLLRSTNDLAFRYGGDEFVILLPETPITFAKEMAQRLIALVDQMTKSMPVKNPPRLSIGAIAMAPNQPATDLLRQADRVLYAIKAARKRKVA
jgi:diguanylate cyclase (GGDEF)-like protein